MIWLILTLLLAVAEPAWATTYYVATTGSDANTCVQAQSISTPKLTITSGATCLSSGDTLSIRGGTYSNVELNNNFPSGGGSWATATTIQAYPGETVTIKPPAAPTQPMLYVTNRSYIIFDRLILDGSTATSGTYEGFFLDDAGGAAHHIRFQNGDVANWRASGVQFASTSHDNELLTSLIHANGITQGQDHGVYIEGDSNILDGNEIYSNAKGWGVHVYNGAGRADSNIIRNNNIHNNGTTGNEAGIILGSGNNNTAYNNLVYANRKGIIMYLNTPDGTTVYNNTVYNNTVVGIQTKDDGADPPTNTLIKNNIIYNNVTNESYCASPCTQTTSNNLVGTDPLFLNAGSNNFRLRYDSPAIDYGTTLAGVPTDYLSTARPQGAAYDAGAYEEWNVKQLTRRR